MADDEPNRAPPRNGGSRPVPDPTLLTHEAIARLEKSLTQFIEGQFEVRDERLRGIDEATKLRLGGMEGVHEEIDVKVGRLADVHEEKFSSIQTQFAERDTRAERESRDNKLAVDAAFAAQEKLAIAQQASNAEAIDKSEASTAEQVRALAKGLDELKDRLTRTEAAKVGAQENRTANTESRSAVIAIVSVVTLVAGTVVGVVVGLIAASPT